MSVEDSDVAVPDEIGMKKRPPNREPFVSETENYARSGALLSSAKAAIVSSRPATDVCF
jgi:hypothetical protein